MAGFPLLNAFKLLFRFKLIVDDTSSSGSIMKIHDSNQCLAIFGVPYKLPY